MAVIDKALEQEFLAELWEALKEAGAIGVHAPRYAHMLNIHGGVETAKRLVQSGELQSGLRALVARGRPDLAVEHRMLTARFRPLFTRPELEAAQWRLHELGVEPPEA